MATLNVDVAGALVESILREGGGDERDVLQLARTSRALRESLFPWLVRGASQPTQQALRFLRAALDVGDAQMANKLRRRMPVSLWHLPASALMKRCWRCSCGEVATEDQLIGSLWGEDGSADARRTRLLAYRQNLETTHHRRWVSAGLSPRSTAIEIKLCPHALTRPQELEPGNEEAIGSSDACHTNQQPCSGLAYKVAFEVTWGVMFASSTAQIILNMTEEFFIVESVEDGKLLAPGLDDVPAWVDKDSLVPTMRIGLPAEQRMFLGCINQLARGKRDGCSWDEVLEYFPGLPSEQIENLLNASMMEGYLFETIDARHYQTCIHFN